MLFKQKGGVKRYYQVLRKNTLEALTQKGQKKKKTKRNREGSKRKTKTMKNSVQIPFIFKRKMIFDRPGGIEPRIEEGIESGQEF